MPYSQGDIARITELIKEIESRKEHPNAAPTYKDVPALQEIDLIVNEQLPLQLFDRDMLEDGIGVMRYLGTSYEHMWRIPYAIRCYKRLLELQVELLSRFGENDENSKDDYYIALRARNYYGKDSCEDLARLAKKLLPEDKRKEVEKQILEDFRPLKHDPVELTPIYLSVIDEVERRMDTDEVKNMHHFQRSDVRRRLLREYGIEWRPVTLLNPGVRFD
ncbi:MAG: hypothetical protein J6M12_02005 [Clostridia bacterium]|nr:hypothetical protein [Clostridia bacterium]